MLGHLGTEEIASLKPMSRVFRALVLGLAELHLGDLPGAAAHSAEAMRELETVPPAERVDIGGIDPVVMVLSQIIAILVNQGYLEQAAAATARSIDDRRAARPPADAGLGAVAGALGAFRRGDLAESMRLSRELLVLAERLGFQRGSRPAR